MLDRLREASRGSHDRLERRLALLDERLDLPRYRLILCRFHAAWQGLEPRLAALLDDPAFFEPRRRGALLAADLAALGVDPAAIPAAPPPALAGPASALGALYVLEGSTLGGRVILRHLDRLALPGTTNARAYFAGYGPHTGRMWAGFVARLEAAASADLPAIVAGAVLTFGHLEWCLCAET